MAVGGRDQFVKLLLLDFFASSIYLARPSSLKTFYERFFKGFNIPPHVAISLGRLMELDGFSSNGSLDDRTLTTMNAYEEGLDEINELSESINFVAERLLEHSSEQGEALVPHVIEQILTLKRQCSWRRNFAEKAIARAHRELGARDTEHNIRESISVKRLSILATIFLPLSLSTSILSMNNRFKELNLILYDFLGVFTVVSSIAILILLLVSGFMKTNPLKFIFRKDVDPVEGYQVVLPWRISFLRIAMIYIWLPALWAVVLVSFIVGMVKNVILGLKILGFGSAALLIYILIILSMMILARLGFPHMLMHIFSCRKRAVHR